MSIVAVLAIAFTSCKKNDDPKEEIPPTVDVAGVALNWTTASLEPNGSITLVATVSPADATNPALTWASDNEAVATVAANGVVTGVAPGKATITATSDDVATIVGSSVITVVAVPEVSGLTEDTPGWGASLGTVRFRSDKTWTIGGLTWSDVVLASACEKETFDGGIGGSSPAFLADCRENKGSRNLAQPWETPDMVEFDYGHLFSMAAAVRFRNILCPEGWRVPRQADFEALVVALDGTAGLQESDVLRDKLVGDESEWGGVFGGSSSGAGAISADRHQTGRYWSVTEGNATNGRHLLVGRAMNASFDFADNVVSTEANFGKGNGLLVRCVR
jgi:uncharacterized protein (TIGR02145 family)